VQRSFDEPATPLRNVTFCVLDLETTGGSPQADAITEIGAVKVRGGEILGTFQTLVNPGLAVPDGVVALTGITDVMLSPAPPLHQVLPALGEFVGGAVLVGHNIRFDVSFLDAALAAHGRPPLGIHRVDTVVLARRLLGDDTLDCKLGTLAERFGLDHRPSHRALDDALATLDLLHLLLERAAGFGVAALDDLLTSPKVLGHRHAAKLRLTARLPRLPGVYLFSDRQGRPLYAGKATDLRSRVRSLFASDDGRTIGPMLRAAHSLDHVVCSSALEAGVLEARLLGRLAPRYNRHGTLWRSYRYVKLTNQRFPRLAVVRAPRRDGAQYLGPLVSTRVARMVVEAIETAVPLRPPADGHDIASPAIVGGLATHPEVAAEGLGGQPSQIDEAVHRQLVQTVVRGFTDRPDLLLEPLRERIDHLAAVGRAGEAQIVRDRYTALARALRRQRRFASLRQAGRIVVDLPGGGGAELDCGRLLRAWGPGGPSAPQQGGDRLGLEPVEVPPDEGPVPCELADELHYVAAWLERHASRVRIVDVEGTFASPLPPIDVAPPRWRGPVVPGAPPPRAGLDPATAETSGDQMAAV
jgi:DNA polymerase-3 subunit epsilon